MPTPTESVSKTSRDPFLFRGECRHPLRPGLRPQTIVWCFLALFLRDRAFAETAPTVLPEQISLRSYLSLVIGYNQSLQARLLEFEVSRRRYEGERSIYEPDFVGSYEYQSNQRQNSKEQSASQRTNLFTEANNVYNAGLEALVPTGARVRLGYSLRDLQNSIPITSGFISTPDRRHEYQTFGGISLTQPLLKGGWQRTTTANMRLAALGSEVTFQDYRKQLMTVISTAEAAYWNLHLAQQQMRFFEESVKLAETLVKDGKVRVQAGAGSELEVLQTQAGLALRQSKLGEARQKFFEALAQLRNLAGIPGMGESSSSVDLADSPSLVTEVGVFQDLGLKALELNPDYLSQVRKAAQEDIRIAYAKNQRLPQLDLKASYGLNGLGRSPGDSFDAASTGNFESWSVGGELRMPLGGGGRSRNELLAARLRKQQALLGIKEIETQVLNAVETALRKVSSTRDAVHTYQTVVQFNKDLLNTQLARLEVGKVESRKVLEVEADLFEAKNAVVEALVQHERAQLELAFVDGTLLGQRNMDLPRVEVQQKTKLMIRHAARSEEHFNLIMKDLRERYERPNTSKP